MKLFEVDHVEDVNLPKLQEGLALLRTCGLPETTMRSIENDLGAEQCPLCKRVWPRYAENIFSRLPRWNPPWELDQIKRRKTIIFRHLPRPSNWSRVYDSIVRVLGDVWDRDEVCGRCIEDRIKEVVPMVMAKFEEGNKRTERTNFLRSLRDCITIFAKSAGRSNKPVTAMVDYPQYVAVISQIMQCVEPKGNAVAFKLLMESAALLKMI